MLTDFYASFGVTFDLSEIDVQIIGVLPGLKAVNVQRVTIDGYFHPWTT